MEEITITLSGLNGSQEITVPAGSTVADLRAEGHLATGAALRQGGLTVEDTAVLVDGGRYVQTPPAAKHGGER